MLAQSQASSAKRGGLAVVSWGLIFLKKKTNKKTKQNKNNNNKENESLEQTAASNQKPGTFPWLQGDKSACNSAYWLPLMGLQSFMSFKFKDREKKKK